MSEKKVEGSKEEVKSETGSNIESRLSEIERRIEPFQPHTATAEDDFDMSKFTTYGPNVKIPTEEDYMNAIDHILKDY